MDAITFLYIALGVGFLLLVIFACVTLIYVMQILRDVNKITESAKDTADRINDYVIQPFALISNVVEHIRPLLTAVQQGRSQVQDKVNRTVNKFVQKSAKKYKGDKKQE